MPKILILDNRDSFVYNLVQLLREAPDCRFDVVRGEQLAWAKLPSYHGILLSPGPGLPTEAPGQMELLRATAATHTVLGVCLGHQALALHFGGRLTAMEHPLHGHTSRLICTDPAESLWHDVPSDAPVGRYHSWAVDPASLPADLLPTAWSHDDDVMMALRHRSLPLYGVQFHPESIMTDSGATIVRNWLGIAARIEALRPA